MSISRASSLARRTTRTTTATPVRPPTPPPPPAVSEKLSPTNTHTSLDSEISNESDFDPSDETLAERLYALRDIIPPTTRGWIANNVSTASSAAWSALSVGSKGAWVVVTTALFLGVPFTLAFSEDAQLEAMEQEMNMRQQGSELLTAEQGGTAEKVGAALGEGGAAKPAL